jgi:hypothetical protein
MGDLSVCHPASIGHQRVFDASAIDLRSRQESGAAMDGPPGKLYILIPLQKYPLLKPRVPSILIEKLAFISLNFPCGSMSLSID